MPKRLCTDRAKWRLLRGKPAQPLPAHYRLDCDYGTPVLTIYREGEGDTPTYLCEVHAAAERDAASATHSKRPSIPEDISPEVDSAIIVCSDGADHVGNLPGQHTVQLDNPIQRAETAALKPNDPSPKSSAPAPKLNDPGPGTPAPDPNTPVAKPSVSTPKAGDLSQTPSAVTSNLSVPVATPDAPASTEAIHRPTPPAKKTLPPKVNSFSRGPVRDLTYGNPAKALVDETIWNLQPGDHEAYRTALREGKSPLEAAQAAGGQLAVVHRKIQEYAVKIDVLLSASNTAINVDGTIHTVLESETLKIIGDDAMTDEQKDAAVAQLGAFQERINHAVDRPTSPLQAHGVALAIANSANWGAACPSIPKELRAAYRAVYSSLRDAIHAAVPEVCDADDRLANLYAAKSDLDAVLYTEIATPDHLRVAASDLSSTHEQKFAEA